MEERDQKQIFFGQQEYSSNQILNHRTHFPCKKALQTTNHIQMLISAKTVYQILKKTIF